ncbi:MAG: UbiX family flavin prenyltransferase [Selenomonadaceae bacterium]|nr:UbiX family flavin prenyltransferase [Selenomonadaceae bacterium]
MRLIVGISGASGVIISIKLLAKLKELGVETHLIITHGAELTIRHETNFDLFAIRQLADRSYGVDDIDASIASGSFPHDGMIIVPCSMKTVAGIAAGYAENLLLRAADICLKEHRKLIIVPREIPLSRIHLRNLKEIADYGATIVPPMLTFYNVPSTIDDQVNHIVGKILMQFGFPGITPAWDPSAKMSVATVDAD